MYKFDDLIHIMEELRSDHGCPWDREQTLPSLKQYIAGETQEVFEAIDGNDMENLCEELGDVLFLIVFGSRIAAEQGLFTMDDVVDGVCRKMIRRHPHVFGDMKVNSREELDAVWEAVKEQEKAEKADKNAGKGRKTLTTFGKKDINDKVR